MKIILTSLLVLVCGWLLTATEQPPAPASTTIRATNDQEQGTHAVPSKQKLTTFLWFDDDAEEAIRLYCSIFKNSKVLSETRWGDGGPLPKGTLMSARFQLEGQEFMALNGGPLYHFSEAISLFVSCETQEEIDGYWDKLTAGGGKPGQCGWLEDKFGLSWQVVPSSLGEMLGDKDAGKAKRVTEAMLQMKKLDLRRLKQAYDQR
jgi:predicted 3-demethylubiquinone-9 3-methyltransferase (glyoxalase superfamily)